MIRFVLFLALGAGLDRAYSLIVRRLQRPRPPASPGPAPLERCIVCDGSGQHHDLPCWLCEGRGVLRPRRASRGNWP